MSRQICGAAAFVPGIEKAKRSPVWGTWPWVAHEAVFTSCIEVARVGIWLKRMTPARNKHLYYHKLALVKPLSVDKSQVPRQKRYSVARSKCMIMSVVLGKAELGVFHHSTLKKPIAHVQPKTIIAEMSKEQQRMYTY